MNLFATVLTHAAPSANYRGESAENRAVIQRITYGRHEFAVVSPEAIRNALRETLSKLGAPCNRTRLHDEEQLAVKFSDYPDPDQYADDFFFGWMVAAGSTDRKKVLEQLKQRNRNGASFQFKRDSIVRMNLAVALEPYRHNTVFTQSPQDKTPKQVKSVTNAEGSQLLHRETTYTAYQYPFALNIEDCREKPQWTAALLRAIGELNNVAGNHARSYFEFAPASIVIRLTPRLVAGYRTYGFEVKDGRHAFPEVVDGILKDDYPGEEFLLGGKIVKDMDGVTALNGDGKPMSLTQALGAKGVVLDRSPQRVLGTVSQRAGLAQS